MQCLLHILKIQRRSQRARSGKRGALLIIDLENSLVWELKGTNDGILLIMTLELD